MRSSFIEIYPSEKDSEKFISVPLVAMLFGKKKLAVNPMKSAIEADTTLLRTVGSTQESDVLSGINPRIERLFKYVAEQVNQDKSELATHIPMLEFIARKYPPSWIMLASLYEEAGGEDNLEKAKEALSHYLETPENLNSTMKAWEKLAILCDQTRDLLGEVHALVEIAQIPNIPFHTISDTANRLNRLFKMQSLLLDTEEKEILVNRLIEVMEKRIQEGDATDCSRIAWLCLHAHNELKAKEDTEKGLALEADNVYILSLADKFNID